MDDDRRTGGPGRGQAPWAVQDADWATALLDRSRYLMMTAEFDEVLGLTAEGAQRALREDRASAWRELTTVHGTALTNLGRFDEAIRVCDDVVESARRDDDPEAMAGSWNVSVVAADRLQRDDDALRRLDGSLAVGEQFLRDGSRRDVLFRAACSAGAIGLVELGDRLLTRILDETEPSAAGRPSPGFLLWARNNQVSARTWWAVLLEHEGRIAAAEKYAGVVELCRGIVASVPDPRMLPPQPLAVYRAHEGHALTALGRHDEAAEALEVARRVLPAEPFTMMLGTVELLCGLSTLRGRPPADPGERAALAQRLVDLARRCHDRRLEAQVWRLDAWSSYARGDAVRAAMAEEQYEDLTERLDWRRRLRQAALLGLRSQVLRRVADGGDWLPPRDGR